MRIHSAFIYGALFALLVPASTSSQLQVSLGAGRPFLSGDYWTRTGDPTNGPDFKAEGGLQVGGQLMVDVAGNAQIGLGIDYSSVGIDGSLENVSIFDVAAVARYFLSSTGARFFVGAKIGYSRHATSREFLGQSFDWSSGGTLFGPTMGIQIPVGSVRIEAAVDGLRDARGDWTSDDGEQSSGAYGKGFRIVPRLGIALTSESR